jgi:hypothetical protein
MPNSAAKNEPDNSAIHSGLRIHVSGHRKPSYSMTYCDRLVEANTQSAAKIPNPIVRNLARGKTTAKKNPRTTPGSDPASRKYRDITPSMKATAIAPAHTAAAILAHCRPVRRKTRRPPPSYHQRRPRTVSGCLSGSWLDCMRRSSYPTLTISSVNFLGTGGLCLRGDALQQGVVYLLGPSRTMEQYPALARVVVVSG